MNQQELATALDVSAKTVSAWQRKGCPVTRTKTGYHFTLKKVLEWRSAHLAPKASTPSTFNEARARKEAALAELREMELQRKKGELVLRSSVRKEVFEGNRQTRDRILNIPARLSGVLAAESDQTQIFILLDTEIRQALEELTHDDSPTPPTQ